MIDPNEPVRMVQLPATTLSAVLREVRANRTAAETAELLRDLGMDAAEAFSRRLRERLGGDAGDLPTDRFWEELSGLLREAGLGEIHQEALHPGVLALTSSDWFESADVEADHPCCHFSTGLLAELVREVAGQDLAAMEVECRATGSPKCSFLLGSAAALEDVFDEMSRGHDYRDALAQLA